MAEGTRRLRVPFSDRRAQGMERAIAIEDEIEGRTDADGLDADEVIDAFDQVLDALDQVMLLAEFARPNGPGAVHR